MSEGPDPIDVEVGINIRRVSKERGLSQDILARALGITFQQVQKYENGKNRISASMLVKTARRLRVQTADLLPRKARFTTSTWLGSRSTTRTSKGLRYSDTTSWGSSELNWPAEEKTDQSAAILNRQKPIHLSLGL